MSALQTGTHNLAVKLDGNIARRRGITDEELFIEVALAIRHITGVMNVYAYELTTTNKYVEQQLEGYNDVQNLEKDSEE